MALYPKTEKLLVCYKPLYKPNHIFHIFDYQADFCVRPMKMFLENIDFKGKMVPRFDKITDEKIISEFLELTNLEL